MIRKKIALVFWVVVMALPIKVFAETDLYHEAKLMEGLIQYIEWPSSSYDGRLKLCTTTLGKKQAYKSAWTSNKTFEIIEEITPSAAPRCHIVFIDKTNERTVLSLIAATNNKPILTISSVDNFIELGGMIKVSWVRVKGTKRKVNLEINTQKAKDSYLNIDPRLLRLIRVKSSN